MLKRGIFQYVTYRGRATFLGVEFCAGFKFLDQNLSAVQTFRVELLTDPSFWGHFEKNGQFKIPFREDSNFWESISEISFKNLLNLLLYSLYF